MLRQGRDSTRMRELGSIHRALSMLQVDRPTAYIGTAGRIYVSIPDTSDTCANLGLPTLPTNWSYRCANPDNLRRIDGHGWIPINFTAMSQGSPLSHLPIDPTNTAASGNYYTYVVGAGWELNTIFESNKHRNDTSITKQNLPGVFAIGTNLSLSPIYNNSGIVGYWSFDGTGNITNNQTLGLTDISGNNNHGTAGNPNATGMAFVPGRVGNAVSFDGVDDNIFAPISPTWLTTSNYTFSLWINMLSRDPTNDVFFHLNNSPGTWRWKLIQSGTNALGWAVLRANETERVYNLNTILPLGVWKFVTVSMGSDVRLYVNGTLERTHAREAESVRTTHGLMIASQIGPAWFTNSIIDDVRIYNRALSAAEVMANFNATR